MAINSLNELKEKSLVVYTGMQRICFPSAREESISVDGWKKIYKNCYSINNRVICYVTDKKVFVTPYTKTAVEVLETEGFHKKFFYVFFSNGDYPKNEKEKWKNLCKAIWNK